MYSKFSLLSSSASSYSLGRKKISGSNWKPNLDVLYELNDVANCLTARTFISLSCKSRALEDLARHGCSLRTCWKKGMNVCKKNGVILRVVRGGSQRRESLRQAPKTWLPVMPLFISQMYLLNYLSGQEFF